MDGGKRIMDGYRAATVIRIAQPIALHAQGLVRGTLAYVAHHGLDWTVTVARGGTEMQESCHGIIGGWHDHDMDGLLASGLACVSLKHNRDGLPCVVADDQAMGRLAAETLLSRGYPALAVFANRTTGRPYFAARREAFIDHLRARGRRAEVFMPLDPAATQAEQRRHLAEWVRARPRPVALFVPMERVALWLVAECLACGLAFGRDVAVLGTGASLDEDLGDLPRPTRLSLPMAVVGWQAALLLHRQLCGDRGPFPQVVLPSLLEEGETTPDLVTADPALRLLRQAADSDRPLRLTALARRAGLSRIQYQRRCASALGAPPAQWLREQRLLRSARLLLEESGQVLSVARRCGFSHANTFAAAFRRRFGVTPTVWRRAGGPPPASG